MGDRDVPPTTGVDPIRLGATIPGAVALLAVVAACAAPAAEGPSDFAGGREVFATCAACHGAEGTGGVGPALDSVRETFPDCETQVEWVQLGSSGWTDSYGETYGSTDKPVNGGMPGFSTMEVEEIRQVVLYERVRFGGADEATETLACGLGDATP